MFWHPDISPDNEPHKVLLKRGEFVDDTRDGRAVPYKVYYPDGLQDKPVPVILWSHGFGGNRDGAGFISRYIASNGYVIVHITHAGTDSSLWEGKPGHPWDILKKASVPREATLHRFDDVRFVLDQLPGWAQEHPEVGALMNLSRVGMSGHSFGALTTQVMAGQHFPDENGKLADYREKRIMGGILYSPVPIRHLVGEEPEQHIYGPIAVPLFHMTGTDDNSPLEGFDYKRRLIVYQRTGASEKHLLILNDGDHMVYNGTRGKLTENPRRQRHETIIKIASLAFWDTLLKKDKNAREWLTKGRFRDYIVGEGQYTYEAIL